MRPEVQGCEVEQRLLCPGPQSCLVIKKEPAVEVNPDRRLFCFQSFKRKRPEVLGVAEADYAFIKDSSD